VIWTHTISLLFTLPYYEYTPKTNTKFGLEKYARICLKRGKVQSKMNIGSTSENDIKKLDTKKHINI
jgi:hypothetical protein